MTELTKELWPLAHSTARWPQHGACSLITSVQSPCDSQLWQSNTLSQRLPLQLLNSRNKVTFFAVRIMGAKKIKAKLETISIAVLLQNHRLSATHSKIKFCRFSYSPWFWCILPLIRIHCHPSYIQKLQTLWSWPSFGLWEHRTQPLHQTWPNLAHKSVSMVYSSMPNYTATGNYCYPCGAEKCQKTIDSWCILPPNLRVAGIYCCAWKRKTTNVTKCWTMWHYWTHRLNWPSSGENITLNSDAQMISKPMYLPLVQHVTTNLKTTPPIHE